MTFYRKCLFGKLTLLIEKKYFLIFFYGFINLFHIFKLLFIIEPSVPSPLEFLIILCLRRLGGCCPPDPLLFFCLRWLGLAAAPQTPCFLSIGIVMCIRVYL